MNAIKLLTDNGKAFVRLVGGIILLAYAYRIVKAVITEKPVGFDQQDWTIAGVCLSIWMAYEAVVAIYQGYIKRKAGE